jgi:hypothetical protein
MVSASRIVSLDKLQLVAVEVAGCVEPRLSL